MEHWRRNRPLLPTGVTHILLWKIFPEIFLLPWRWTSAPRSWEAYEGSDEECDEDGDGHDDEVEVDDDEFPGKAEAGAPVTLWGFGAASEITIRLRERKMHQRDCFLFQSCQLCLSICPPVMSRLFQSYLNKLVLFLCWATRWWMIHFKTVNIIISDLGSGSWHIRLLTEIPSPRQRGGRSRWSPWYRDARLWCLIMSLGPGNGTCLGQ